MALRTLQVARPRNSRGSLGVFVETWEVRKSGPSLGCAVFFCTTSFMTCTLARICWSCKFCFSRSFHYTHERHIDFMLPAPVSFTYACTSVQTSAPCTLDAVCWLQVGWRSCLAPPVARCFLVLLSCCSRSLSELLFYEAGSHLLPTVCHTWTFSDSHIKAGVAEERPEIAVGSCYSCRLDLCLFFSFLRIQCF